MFGISYEDGAFICIMEDGNSYGAVSADIAGRVHSYNLVYPKYSVLHYDNYKVTGRTAKLLLMYEQADGQELGGQAGGGQDPGRHSA